MTNKEIYEIMDRLGMVEEDNNLKACSADEPIDTRSDAEVFAQDTATDLVSTMNFVDSLCIYNDLDTIKKFLVTLIYTNKE